MDNSQNIGSADWMTQTSQAAPPDSNVASPVDVTTNTQAATVAPSLDDIRAKIADLGPATPPNTQDQAFIEEFPEASPEELSAPASIPQPVEDPLTDKPSEPVTPPTDTFQPETAALPGASSEATEQPVDVSTPTTSDLPEKTEDEKREDLLNEELTTLLGKETALQAEKDEINSKATEAIENIAIDHIMESLSKEKEVELTNLLATKDNAAISQFFTDNNINLQQTMAQAGLIYKSNVIDSKSVAGN